MEALGFLLQSGGPVEPDVPAAFRWLERAAELGSVYAQRNLGHMYQLGIGTAPDLESAKRWFAAAAAAGDSAAAEALGALQ